jgi:5-methyltetrahydropteroyltriglutamate--homocysteine methyltransferase
MRQSSEKILVSHAGALPAPEDFATLLEQVPLDRDLVRDQLPGAVKEVVARQVAVGIDVVNDGELSKRLEHGGGFTYYAKERLSGLEPDRNTTRARTPKKDITARDAIVYPGFHAQRLRSLQRAGGERSAMVCVEPLHYIGHDQVRADIANLKSALEGTGAVGFLSAVAPGTIEHWIWNEHYRDDEELVFALADAMREEYEAITGSGLILQIDDPDLLDGWQMFPAMSVADYRRYAQVRVDALNLALEGCPRELVRLHVCWGSGHGPHVSDLPLEEIVDLVLSVRASCVSIEASNPRHDHEWRVWESAGLPGSVLLMPGVVGHCTDIVEHPRLVADRLERFAHLLGKETVIAGTDCGLGTRVGHAEIAWGKLGALAQGAALASDELWGRS